jgi:predicted PurR-regulated permease PerM
LVAGLPGAGLWTLIFLFAAALQIAGPLLVLPVIYMFAIACTTKAIVFLVWCLFVALMDNVLKPLLLGRGAAVPVAVVFLGAIGGFISVGIGLFVGAIVLSVGYKLFLAWLEGPVHAGNNWFKQEAPPVVLQAEIQRKVLRPLSPRGKSIGER